MKAGRLPVLGGFLLLAIASVAATAVAVDARGRLLGNTAVGRVTSLPPLLFDVDRQDEVLAQRDKLVPTSTFAPLLPNRIYLVYSKEDKLWFYVLTDFEGHFPEPFEVVRWRSVFSGRYLGARKPDQRYINIDKLLWAPSFKPEVHDFYVFTNPPFFKVIEFLPVMKVAEGGKK